MEDASSVSVSAGSDSTSIARLAWQFFGPADGSRE